MDSPKYPLQVLCNAISGRDILFIEKAPHFTEGLYLLKMEARKFLCYYDLTLTVTRLKVQVAILNLMIILGQ